MKVELIETTITGPGGLMTTVDALATQIPGLIVVLGLTGSSLTLKARKKTTQRIGRVRLTHESSGWAIAGFDRIAPAFRLAEQLGPLVDWTADNGEIMNSLRPDIRREISRLIKEAEHTP